MNEKNRRSTCPIACTLDIIGDRWSMVIIRDLFLGVSKFNDFLRSPEHITTSILATRLQQLEAEGLITKIAYQNNPIRWEYSLSQKGQELGPLMKEMVNWARNWQAEVIRAPFPEEPISYLTSRLT